MHEALAKANFDRDVAVLTDSFAKRERFMAAFTRFPCA